MRIWYLWYVHLEEIDTSGHDLTRILFPSSGVSLWQKRDILVSPQCRNTWINTACTFDTFHFISKLPKHTSFKLVYLSPVSISGAIEATDEFFRPNAEYILEWMQWHYYWAGWCILEKQIVPKYDFSVIGWKSMLTLCRFAIDQIGLWPTEGAGQCTDEIFQTVRDLSSLGPKGQVCI